MNLAVAFHAVTRVPRLPRGIEPAGGAWGLEQVSGSQLAPGVIVWAPEAGTARLRPVQITKRGATYDGRETWAWIWLAGPEAGTEHIPTYSYSFWRPLTPARIVEDAQTRLAEEIEYVESAMRRRYATHTAESLQRVVENAQRKALSVTAGLPPKMRKAVENDIAIIVEATKEKIAQWNREKR